MCGLWPRKEESECSSWLLTRPSLGWLGPPLVVVPGVVGTPPCSPHLPSKTLLGKRGKEAGFRSSLFGVNATPGARGDLAWSKTGSSGAVVGINIQKQVELVRWNIRD